jgi:homocitrate synthase NifV
VLGKHSGSKGLALAFSRIGIELQGYETESLLDLVRHFVTVSKRTPTNDDLLHLYAQVQQTSAVEVC